MSANLQRYIKNNTGTTVHYMGVPVLPGAFFEIPPSKFIAYANLETLISDIASGNTSVSRDGVNVISGLNAQLNALKGFEQEFSFTETGDLNVQATLSDTLTGGAWRTELDKTEITLSKLTYTTLKTLTTGTLHSFVVDFTSDKIYIKVVIDGSELFDINLDDLEDVQSAQSSHPGGTGDIIAVKTGSKISFRPPKGLTYSSLTISAKAEQNNRKMSRMLINYSVGS